MTYVFAKEADRRYYETLQKMTICTEGVAINANSATQYLHCKTFHSQIWKTFARQLDIYITTHIPVRY